MNPNCKSIESELEKALFLGGLFEEPNYGRVQKLQWTRSARTDRGVHALGQCCSMRLYFPVDPVEKEQAIARINRILPSDMRLHAVTKVTRAFNSHMFCSSRRYQYLIPTYVFMPVSEMNALLQSAMIAQGPLVDCARNGGFAEPGSSKFLSHDSLKAIHQRISAYRCPQEQLDLLSKALAFYKGTLSYHNFTSGKDSDDSSSKRFITECFCSAPFLSTSSVSASGSGSSSIPSVDNSNSSNSSNNTQAVEYVCVTINGQSFVLNQIRKMIGLAVDVTRGATPYETIQTAVDPKIRVSIE